MKNIVTLLVGLGCCLASLCQNIVQGEYFIDTDLGYGNNTLVNFTPAADGVFSLSVNFTGLPPGFHKLYIRTKDSDGKWSLTARRNIDVPAGSSETTITGAEYFIDTDQGVGNNTPVSFTPAADGSFSLPVNLTGIPPGFHKLYIRTKDSDGKWSLTARRNIDVPAIFSKTTITGGEYFFDADPGFGNGIPITVSPVDSIILQNFNAATAALSEGYHKLYGRLIDNTGSWSFTFRRNIEMFKDVDNKVDKVEYFFTTDLGVGECISVTFATPSADGSFTFDIPRGNIPASASTLFVRVQNDLDGKWSLTQLKALTELLPLTLLDFSAVKQNNTALLTWQTANEVNTSYFNVLRSKDGIHFSSVGQQPANNTPGSKNNYSYKDDITGLEPGIVYYRLQMVDLDGTYSFSKINRISIDADGGKIRIYPNPAGNYFIISHYKIANAAKATIQIKDIAGRTLVNQKFSSGSVQRVNISSLSKGMYLVSVVINGDVHTEKLMVK